MPYLPIYIVGWFILVSFCGYIIWKDMKKKQEEEEFTKEPNCKHLR